MAKLIAQGAEAIITLNKQTITKDRVKKSYRLPILDERLRKSRTKRETRLLEKAISIIPVPKITKSDEKNKQIQMEFIEGKKLSENLDNIKNAKDVCTQIGQNIAKLHDSDIIHGDLTTSNMILKENLVYFIDFGLSYESSKSEDKAVDLHLIKQALEAKHFQHFELYWKSIIEGYKISKYSKPVLKRLEAVEKRGRYKQAY
jgi:Kae1-associated kinase Bud32